MAEKDISQAAIHMKTSACCRIGKVLVDIDNKTYVFDYKFPKSDGKNLVWKYQGKFEVDAKGTWQADPPLLTKPSK